MEKINLYDIYGLPRSELGLVFTGTELMKEIVAMGYSAYIVGGCVRDIVMGKVPKDVDIATNMPIDVIKKHYRTIEYGGGERHGTVIVRHQNEDFELTQFRSESTYSDNRRPDEVTFVDTFKEDTLRRDFTINAMGINCDGEIVDYHGGIDDIKNRVIRTVGRAEERFGEDSLRILRAARFAAKMGFDIEESTRLAMTKLAHTISNVSDERIRDEFEKSMVYPYSFGVFIRILDTLDIIREIFTQFKSNCIDAICRAASKDKIVNFALMFPEQHQFSSREKLKLSSSEIKSIEFCVSNVYLCHILEDKKQLETKTKVVINKNFHYLMYFYEAIFRKELNPDLIAHYHRLAEVYTLDKDVNAYIASKGVTGSNFGKVVNGYKEWAFKYFDARNLLPLEIEWKKFIDWYIVEVENFISLGKR